MVFTYDYIDLNKCQAAEFCFHDSTIQMHTFDIRLHRVILGNEILPRGQVPLGVHKNLISGV